MPRGGAALAEPSAGPRMLMRPHASATAVANRQVHVCSRLFIVGPQGRLTEEVNGSRRL
jgi:hypothetical protein